MSRLRSRRFMMGAVAAQFVVSLSLNFAFPFLTLFIHSDLGISSLSEAAFWAGLAQFLAGISVSVMAPVWGWLCDRVGGKKMLVRVLLAHAAMMGLLSFSTNVYQVLVLRLLHGILSGTSVVVMAIIASSVEEEQLPQAISYQQSVQTAGLLLGPAVGGAMATVMGFRACFLAGGLMIASTVPFVLWAHFESERRPTELRERADWTIFRKIAPVFISLLAVQAAYNFVTPIMPVYLSEAGLAEDLLTQYTAGIAALTALTYAVSAPLTTRVFRRKDIPILLVAASGIVFLQGMFRQTLVFIVLRIAQGFLYSPALTRLLGEAGRRRSNKGLTMGILNSARFFGDAMGPFLASTITYMTDLTTAFTVTASISMLAAMLTLKGKEEGSETSTDT